MFPCQYKQLLGLYCPMCGFQRSIIELLNGNFMNSVKIFPAIITMIIAIVVIIFFYLFKPQKLKIVVQAILISNLGIMILTCIVNNLFI